MKMHKTRQLVLHWFLLIFQWSLDINLKPLAAPRRPISQTWPNKRSLAFTTCSSYFPPSFQSFHFPLPLLLLTETPFLKCLWPLLIRDLLRAILMLCDCRDALLKHDISMSISHISSRCELNGLMFLGRKNRLVKLDDFSHGLTV